MNTSIKVIIYYLFGIILALFIGVFVSSGDEQHIFRAESTFWPVFLLCTLLILFVRTQLPFLKKDTVITPRKGKLLLFVNLFKYSTVASLLYFGAPCYEPDNSSTCPGVFPFTIFISILFICFFMLLSKYIKEHSFLLKGQLILGGLTVIVFIGYIILISNSF